MPRDWKVLVIDDEPAIRNLLNRVLTQEKFEVLTSINGQDGFQTALRQRPDLIILDLSLPDIHGEEVCQKIRRSSAIENTPVLILTGQTAEGLPARCLNGGADAYLPKPFDIEELLANVRALLRRTHTQETTDDQIMRGRITIRVGEHQVMWNNTRVRRLAPKEFELLKQLVAHSPRVLDKNTLAIKVWDTPAEHLHQRTLDVHIRRIRKKLGPTAATCLKTIPAVGFQWMDETAPATLIPTASR